MGYYTQYQLAWEPHDQEVEIFLEANEEAYYGITPEGESADEAKWYDHEKNMRALSKKFPHILFTLSGEGEEAGDVWKKYFKDGKMQATKAVIVLDDFNPTKLH